MILRIVCPHELFILHVDYTEFILSHTIRVFISLVLSSLKFPSHFRKKHFGVAAIETATPVFIVRPDFASPDRTH